MPGESQGRWPALVLLGTGRSFTTVSIGPCLTFVWTFVWICALLCLMGGGLCNYIEFNEEYDLSITF